MENWKEYNERSNGCGEALIDMLIPKCKTAVLLYFDDKREIYLPDDIVIQILRAFEKVANFRSSKELLCMPYHPDYGAYDVNIAKKYIAGKRGISCDADAMDYLLGVAEHTRGVFLFKYAKTQNGVHRIIL